MRKRPENENVYDGGRRVMSTLLFIIMVSLILSLTITTSRATPVGPSIQFLSNTTKTGSTGTLANHTLPHDGNANVSSGGFIFTVLLTSTQQNSKWKGYVGNVTGTLVLDDSGDNTLFAWPLTTSIAGEVYATRSSGTIDWNRINCTWIPENATSSEGANRTVEELENKVLNHTSSDDNITSTFTLTNHSAIDIGGRIITKNTCFSVQTYQGSTASVDGVQTFADSDEANFTQVILYDGNTTTNGNVVYVTFIEQDIEGFTTAQTYDFQMILPENALTSFTSSTAYYFYVELT